MMSGFIGPRFTSATYTRNAFPQVNLCLPYEVESSSRQVQGGSPGEDHAMMSGFAR